MEKLLQFILIFSSIFTFSQIEIKIAPSDKRFPSTQYIKIEILNKSNHNYIVPLDTLDLRPFDDNYDWKDFDKKGNKTKIADGVTKAIREEDGDIVYDSRHDLMLYQKEESERIGIGIVDFWYADEMKTEQNFRLDW